MRLLALLGSRRTEIAAMRWSEITRSAEGGAVWVVPGARTKTGAALALPLDGLVLAQLPAKRGDRDLIFGKTDDAGFSGWSRCKAALDRRLGNAVASWTLHDLRRTFSTRLNELGAEPHIVEAILNHSVKGVGAVYNHARYMAAKGVVLATWHGHVAALVGLPRMLGENNVTLIRRAG